MLRELRVFFLTVYSACFMFAGSALAQVDGTLLLNGSLSGTLNSENPGDIWEITTTIDGMLELSTVSTDAEVYFRLKDEEGSSITARNSEVEGNTRSAQFMIGVGTYTVGIYKYQGGEYPYMLSNVFTPASLPNDQEPNDSTEEEGTLELNGSGTGHLGFYCLGYDGKTSAYYDNVDWWVVTTTSDGNLKITTESDNDDLLIEIHMKDFELNNIKSGYPEGSSTSVNYNVVAGSYHIKVNRPAGNPGQSGYGSYTITSALTPASLPNDPEPNDSAGEAAPLEPNGSYTGHLGYCIRGNFGDLWVQYEFETKDYWKIVTPSDGILNIITECEETLEIDLSLYDHEMNLIKSSYADGTQTTVQYHLVQGTYYINAKRSDSGQYGSYTITSTLTPASLPNDPEPNDSEVEATTLAINSSDTGHLGFREPGSNNYDTSDWWIITTASNGLLDISTTTDDDTLEITLYFYDHNLEHLKTIYNTGVTTNLQLPLAAGTYYVDAHRKSYTKGFGAYTITNSLTVTSLSSDLEPNNSAEEAIKLEPDGRGTGHLGFYIGGGKYDTSDWWVVTTALHDTLEITAVADDDTLEIYLYLYDKDMKRLKTAYNDSVSTHLQYENTSEGAYYICVQRKSYTNGFGSYTIYLGDVDETLVEESPTAFHVYPPYPNPFNPVVTILYEIPVDCYVSLTVYDIVGRKVAVLKDINVSAGVHKAVWNGTDQSGRLLSSGVYFYRLEAGVHSTGGKMLLLR